MDNLNLKLTPQGPSFMSKEVSAAAASTELPGTAGVLSGLSLPRRRDVACILLLLALNAALWAPRAYGPIELRWDAGVYYILGTSLAEGKGYRLLNEPGEIRAVQYPPLLPLVVAAHQWVVGTSDPAICGTALRWAWALACLAVAVGTYALGRVWLSPKWALLAGTIVAASPWWLFMSDACTAEVPSALALIGFVAVARRTGGWGREWWAGVLGAVCYLLRTASLALLVAWVLDALVRLRWKRAAFRAAVAVVPVLAWQGYVAWVMNSAEYAKPAYAYQRAPYQYYNVSYSENLKLLDPFDPEKGPATVPAVAGRTWQNVRILAMAAGEAISAPAQLSHREISGIPPALDRLHRAGLRRLPWVAALATACGVLGLLLRGEWLIALALAVACALMALTPWGGQFLRYMLPVLPLLAIGLAVGLAEVWRWRGWGRRWLSALARAAVILLLLGILLSRVEAIHTLYWGSSDDSMLVDSRGRGHVARLFFMNADWRAMEGAATWLRRNVRPDSRVITVVPHWIYLRTGLQAVQPPYVADAVAVQDLVDSVPANCAIVGAERNDGGDPMWRYLMPAVRKYPDRWRVVYEDQHTGLRVYERHRTANAESGAEVHEQ
jgi:hypothetical protein